jgi:hypothetical protein
VSDHLLAAVLRRFLAERGGAGYAQVNVFDGPTDAWFDFEGQVKITPEERSALVEAGAELLDASADG